MATGYQMHPKRPSQLIDMHETTNIQAHESINNAEGAIATSVNAGWDPRGVAPQFPHLHART